MKYLKPELRKRSFWQLVFSQSRVNGALYHGDELPGYKWDWPKDTYLRRSLRRKKTHAISAPI